MTSMAMVDLMLAVEAEFDVTIPQREMTPANFRSITCLAQLLARL
jgi:acyl carrier protein